MNGIFIIDYINNREIILSSKTQNSNTRKVISIIERIAFSL